jgi:hypothetical protein
MDVSGSMAESVRTAESGRRLSWPAAQLSLIQQFASYAAAHPDKPVVVGLYEFERDGRRARAGDRALAGRSVTAEAALAGWTPTVARQSATR